MSYNENDKHHVLESGGMFEMYAYGNGQPLTVVPDKKIQVQLATKFDIAGGEVYVLDKQNKVWNKKTPFAGRPESNEQLSDNKQDLWQDNIWNNMDGWNADNIGRGVDTVLSIDPSTGLTMMTIVTSEYANLETRDQAFKTMNVDQMELYNCDRILDEQTVPVVAEFKLDGYSQKVTSEIYVVYKNRNAVLTYYPDQFAKDFKLLPNEDFTIFTFSKDGKIAVLDKAFTSTFNVKSFSNKKVVFPMKVYAKSPATKAELALMTGL